MIMSMDCAVVIPVYKETMRLAELASFRQCCTVLGHWPIILATYRDLSLEQYDIVAGECNVSVAKEYFPQRCFSGIHSYNCLMISPFFYERFLGYRYILIFQLDAWIFSDMLGEWCSRGYDYVGGPLFAPGRKELSMARTGNGGLSLRRVEAFHKACTCRYNPFVSRQEDSYITFNKRILYFLMLLFSGWFNALRGFFCHWVDEDRFFSYALIGTHCELNVPLAEESINFSFDLNPDICMMHTGGRLPFGCHQWYLHIDFWNKYINYSI